MSKLQFWACSSVLPGIGKINLVTNRLFRDTSAWYNIVVAFDLSNSTAEDRIKIYINGVRETSFSTNSNPSNTSKNIEFVNSNGSVNIGNYFAFNSIRLVFNNNSLIEIKRYKQLIETP